MQRRKFIAGLGSLAAGSAAVLGTGAYEGAYVHGDRSIEVDVVSDDQGYLKLKDTSPMAEYESVSGGWEGGQGVSKLKLTIDRLNPDMDTRLDDVFRVQNTTGRSVRLLISDSPDWNGSYEDVFQIWAQPSSGDAVRLDDGGHVTLGPGEEVEINIYVLLGQYDPNGHDGMKKISITADGTDS